MNTKVRKKATSSRSVRTFLGGRACSDALFRVLNDAYGDPRKAEETAAQPLAGGIVQHGYQCGMVWGAALGAGAQAFRLHGSGPEAEAKAMAAAQKVTESFHAMHGTVNCSDITHMNKSKSSWDIFVYFMLKGGSIGCFRMAGRYGPVAFREVDAVLADDTIPVPAPPVSCAAQLARKMGATEEQAVTVAGLAGGIGLCGEACGALGAAIWLRSLRLVEAGRKVTFKDRDIAEGIEVFLKSTDYRMECSEIVGRKFDDIADHAAYVADGGCARLIENLASQFGETSGRA